MEEARYHEVSAVLSRRPVVLLRRRWAHPLEALTAVCTLAAAFLAPCVMIFFFDVRLTIAAIASFVVAIVLYPTLLVLAARVTKSRMEARQEGIPTETVHATDRARDSLDEDEHRGIDPQITRPLRGHDECSIERHEGYPSKAERLAEKTRWRRFLEFLSLSPKMRHLGEAYAEAKTTRELHEAIKIAAEAAQIAARADLARTAATKVVNDEIERIITNERLPMEAVKMQLAALAKEHPEILEQLERVGEIVEKLRIVRGVEIEVMQDQNEARIGKPRSAVDEDDKPA